MAQNKNGVSNASPKTMTAIEMKKWYEENKSQLGQFANFASTQEAFKKLRDGDIYACLLSRLFLQRS